MRGNSNDFPLQLEHTYEPPPEHVVGLREVLGVLRRDWRYPLFGCLIGLLLAIGYVLANPALYTSSARILVDRSLNRYLQTNKIIDQPTFDQAELESQIHILSSESIIVPVIRKLKLAEDAEFVGPPRAAGQQIVWSVSELVRTAKKYIGWQNDAPVRTEAVLERIAVEAFLKRLSVYREEVANVITVSFQSEDPNKAAAIANAVADTYLATSADAKFKSTRMTSQWLQDRLTDLKVQAVEADRALQNYKIANNLVEVEKGLKSSDQLTTLNAQLNGARMAMAEAKARFDRIQQTISEGKPSATVTDALNNSVIVALRSQYLDLSARAAEIEGRVGPGHMAVTKLHDRMGELLLAIRAEEQRLAGSYASEYQIAKAREAEVATAIAKLAGETEKKSRAEVKMRDIESSADTFRQLYSNFLQKFQEMNTNQTQAIAIEDARIVTRASPALNRNSRRASAVLAGSLIMGLLLGAGAAIARELTADVFRTPNVVRDVTGIHCVMLPTVEPNRMLAAPLRRTKSNLIEEVVLNEPYSRFTESLRNVKALINTAQHVHSAKVIGVVSSVPKEGKTIIAANLAALMIATSGGRTLLIDGDLHLRLLTASLAPDAREGLLEALVDPTRLASLVYKRKHSGLDVLPCVLSARIPNAAELLGSPQMEQLLAAARSTYDYIIIEIPPIMSVVDIKMIERFIDRFIFVVEWGQTKRSLVMEALSEAEFIRERLIGMVLNKADPGALRKIESYKGSRFRDYYDG
jgi:polysaccharide biosynthesis transport protein